MLIVKCLSVYHALTLILIAVKAQEEAFSVTVVSKDVAQSTFLLCPEEVDVAFSAAMARCAIEEAWVYEVNINDATPEHGEGVSACVGSILWDNRTKRAFAMY